MTQTVFADVSTLPIRAAAEAGDISAGPGQAIPSTSADASSMTDSGRSAGSATPGDSGQWTPAAFVEESGMSSNVAAEAGTTFDDHFQAVPATAIPSRIPQRAVLTLADENARARSSYYIMDGRVQVQGVEAGATWQWSDNGGATWSDPLPDSVTTFTPLRDGSKNVIVKVTDSAGNASTSDTLSFYLVTTVPPAPVFHIEPATADDLALVLTASFSTCDRLIVQTDQQRTVADISRYSPQPHRLVPTTKVTGLGEADGEYRLLSREQAAATAGWFGEKYSAAGRPVVDQSKEVYQRINQYYQKEDWYAWAAVGGGYVISQRDSGDFWYQEDTSKSGTLPAQMLREVGNWKQLTAGLPDLQFKRMLNNDPSLYQKSVEGVMFDSWLGNGLKNTLKIFHQNFAGTVSEPRYYEVSSINSVLPPSILFATASKGGQFSTIKHIDSGSLLSGAAFATEVEGPRENAFNKVHHIHLEFSGRWLNVSDDKLILDQEIALDQDLSAHDVEIGQVRGLMYQYEKTKHTLNVSKLDSSQPFTAQEISNIIQSIKLRNAHGSFGDRTMTVQLEDANHQRSLPATATLAASSESIWLDLNTEQAGIQNSAVRHIKSGDALQKGVAIISDIASPKSSEVSSLHIRLGGRGLDPETDRLVLDQVIKLNENLEAVKGKTIGGVANLSYAYDTYTSELTITASSGRHLKGNEVRSILRAIRLQNDKAMDGEREFEVNLVRVGEESGAPSTSRLVFDTQAPTLDLDKTLVGVQSLSQKTINIDRALKGEGLFDKPVASPVAFDIAELRLKISGPYSARKKDSLVVDNEKDGRIDFTKLGKGDDLTVGGVTGMSFQYDARDQELVLKKTSGSLLNGLDAQAILEALKFQTTSSSKAKRTIKVSVIDQSDNSSTANAEISLDITAAPTIKASLVKGNQLSYKVITLNDALGTEHTHNLSFGESARLALPDGMAPEAFLKAVRGVSAEWGGMGITGDKNTTFRFNKSHTMFDAPLAASEKFTMVQQGGFYAKASAFSFDLSPDRKQIYLSHQGSAYESETDVYEMQKIGKTSDRGYDIGNIKILYQVDTGQSNTMPTIKVKFDGTGSAVGDSIALYEGEKQLASKILTADDIGQPDLEVSLTLPNSLSSGTHQIVSRYTEISGNTSQSKAVTVDVSGQGSAPEVANVNMRLSEGTGCGASDSSGGTAKYLSARGSVWVDSKYESGPEVVVSAGKPFGDSESYLITAKMGGKLLGFDVFDAGAGNYGYGSLQTSANLTSPNAYKDLEVSVTNVSDGESNGYTSTLGGIETAYYWKAQNLDNLTASNAGETIYLGKTKRGVDTLIQTGAGKDTLVLGMFGKTAVEENTDSSSPTKWAATITDFSLGEDVIRLEEKWRHPDTPWWEAREPGLTRDTLNQFVKSTAPILGGSGTSLVVDLDGSGPGTQTYTLNLQHVAYNPNNTHTLFGV